MYLKKILSFLVLALVVLACSKSNDGGDDEPAEDLGDLVFYIEEVFPCSVIYINIFDSSGGVVANAQLSGSAVNTGEVGCDQANSVTIHDLPYGVYNFEYSCNSTTLGGQIGVSRDCYAILMIN